MSLEMKFHVKWTFLKAELNDRAYYTERISVIECGVKGSFSSMTVIGSKQNRNFCVIRT